MLSKILSFLSEGAAFLKSREDNLDTRLNVATEKRLRAALDAAEKYMLVNERVSPYDDLTDKKQKRYLKHFKKRFLHYND